jgi:hypothetical protein
VARWRHTAAKHAVLSLLSLLFLPPCPRAAIPPHLRSSSAFSRHTTSWISSGLAPTWGGLGLG